MTSTGLARRATAGWAYLQQNEHFLLLASTQPALDVPRLPLLFYFFFDDIDSVLTALEEAGAQPVRVGYPPHALGGEVRVADPDGNTVLLGQREASASQEAVADDAASPRFSLLREAAALVAAEGGTTASCLVGDPHGGPCPRKADVKLADSAGNMVWACLTHADEILMTVPGAFIASQDSQGIAGFLSARRR